MSFSLLSPDNITVMATEIDWDDSSIKDFERAELIEAYKRVYPDKDTKGIRTETLRERILSEINHNIHTAGEFLGLPDTIEVPITYIRSAKKLEEDISEYISSEMGYLFNNYVIDFPMTIDDTNALFDHEDLSYTSKEDEPIIKAIDKYNKIYEAFMKDNEAKKEEPEAEIEET